jgi:hypothetical protein
MLDWALAVVSMLGVIAFMAVVTFGVMEPDLWIVVLLVLGIGIYDFVKSLREQNSNGAK